MATVEELYGTDIAYKDDFVKSATGDVELISGIENLKEALMRRLVTSPGTIIHRPGYGVGIKDFQNRLSSLTARRELAQRIVEQFGQDPRVQEVTGLDITQSDSQPDVVKLLVKVTLVGYGEVSISFSPFEDA